MNNFNPLPAHQAQALGQLLHATLEGRPDAALSEGDAPAPPSWGQLAKLRSTASKAQPPRADVALSAPPASAPKPQTVRIVNGATEAQRRAADIIAHEKVRDFEAKYGRGATLEDAREQDLTNEYLDRFGLRS
jgi:hypothetical protein